LNLTASIEAQDINWMSRAIRLARQGQYTTRQNPNVGCVLVAGGELVGEGFHYRAGEGHAEVMAIKAARTIPESTTAYVTLEPCNHQGKTGPCTQALIDAGISTVVYGMQDPNPLVSGSGLRFLQDAGIKIRGPVLETEAHKLNLGFISRMEKQRPWIRCKMAASLDGATAMRSGESKWITSPEARADVQKWRARSCAVLTGIGSVLNDDSRLTLRDSELKISNVEDVLASPPLRVVLDSQLRLPLDAAILQGNAKTVVMTLDDSAQAKANKVKKLEKLHEDKVEVVLFKTGSDDRIPLLDVVEYLAKEKQCNDLLVEAGATLTGQLLNEGLLDECILYQAPVLMGSSTKPLFDLPLGSMQEKKLVEITDVRNIGPDRRIIFKCE
jgi:diaminohydroxyphosphoribosylaminopyrimidine deaminase/5-amino-6-(5-phosphoribosylamino)uracil reductase